eukprot:365247-Chlamydomonas_euryale.AAC.10
MLCPMRSRAYLDANESGSGAQRLLECRAGGVCRGRRSRYSVHVRRSGRAALLLRREARQWQGKDGLRARPHGLELLAAVARGPERVRRVSLRGRRGPGRMLGRPPWGCACSPQP